MKLTPQAIRLITGAVHNLPDRGAHAKWLDWSQRSPTGDVPYDAAIIALEALISEAEKLTAKLEDRTISEDDEADLLNDLGYIQAIEKGLRQEGVGR